MPPLQRRAKMERAIEVADNVPAQLSELFYPRLFSEYRIALVLVGLALVVLVSLFMVCQECCKLCSLRALRKKRE